MPIRIQPSRFDVSRGVPPIRNRGIVAAQTFTKGAPLALNAGSVQEHAGGATVTGFYAIANEDVTAGASSGPESTLCNASECHPSQIFMGQLDNGGSVATVDAANLDVDYGLLETSGDWYVDELDVTNVVVQVVDIDTDLNVVFFKFLASAIDPAVAP